MAVPGLGLEAAVEIMTAIVGRDLVKGPPSSIVAKQCLAALKSGKGATAVLAAGGGDSVGGITLEKGLHFLVSSCEKTLNDDGANAVRQVLEALRAVPDPVIEASADGGYDVPTTPKPPPVPSVAKEAKRATTAFKAVPKGKAKSKTAKAKAAAFAIAFGDAIAPTKEEEEAAAKKKKEQPTRAVVPAAALLSGMDDVAGGRGKAGLAAAMAAAKADYASATAGQGAGDDRPEEQNWLTLTPEQRRKALNNVSKAALATEGGCGGREEGKSAVAEAAFVAPTVVVSRRGGEKESQGTPAAAAVAGAAREGKTSKSKGKMRQKKRRGKAGKKGSLEEGSAAAVGGGSGEDVDDSAEDESINGDGATTAGAEVSTEGGGGGGGGGGKQSQVIDVPRSGGPGGDGPTVEVALASAVAALSREPFFAAIGGVLWRVLSALRSGRGLNDPLDSGPGQAPGEGSSASLGLFEPLEGSGGAPATVGEGLAYVARSTRPGTAARISAALEALEKGGGLGTGIR